jgi:ribosomal protein L24E
MPKLTDEQKCAALSYDPFAGDFGEVGDRVLKNKIVTARKGGECHICGQPIEPGTEIRVMSEISDGEMMSFRFCHLCCVAMAASWTDSGKEIERRTALHPNLQRPAA